MNTSWSTAAVYAAWIVVAAAFYIIDQYTQALSDAVKQATRSILGMHV